MSECFFFPLPGVRVSQHTFEPDVLVALKGRAGVIEIDGPQHSKRYAFDKSKDHLLENAGIALVSRIVPEEIGNPKDLDASGLPCQSVPSRGHLGGHAAHSGSHPSVVPARGFSHLLLESRQERRGCRRSPASRRAWSITSGRSAESFRYVHR
ncbi:hypothetical protein [Nonomuraea basaltis]|uniref:hypothetical protein n=1 Tax=Nonomuraea basaltis TaxID=2495887 RepID=UPI0014873A5B|nr:hypothetical protein [Nonomuraea basaltis]